jgi:hypothetical protein
MLSANAQYLGFNSHELQAIFKTKYGGTAVWQRLSTWPPRYSRIQNGEAGMADKIVTVTLNQQQRELVDRTIAKGIAPDRAALIRFALREYAAKRAKASETPR